MNRITVVLLALSVLVAACSSGDSVDTASTLQRPANSTSSVATTVPLTSATSTPTPTTTTSTVVDAGADYYHYGDGGLFRVQDGVETRVIDGPVERVWDDHMGGVLFGSAGETYWLRAGETEPIAVADLDPDNTWLVQFERAFTGVVASQPTVFYAGSAGPVGADHPCGGWELVGRDLRANTVRSFMCFPEEDASLGIGSVGGDRFVGAVSVAIGSAGTSLDIRFWDIDGEAVQNPNNPMPESCAPCELAALISPDGESLAYRHRADAKWPPEVWDEVPDEEWWEESRQIPAEIVVMNLESGTEEWRADTGAGIGLADFDGRYLVTTTWRDRPIESIIHDTWSITSPSPCPVESS